MHVVTFYPLGNADCCKIDLENGQRLLFDFANFNQDTDESDARYCLAQNLRQTPTGVGADYFDVVAFTHVDDDHIHGFSDFFYLEHARRYQIQDRVRIKELWVPAAIILEAGLEGEARILQAEARYRLRMGTAIRVFSRPARLGEWLKENNLEIGERDGLITDAGELVPGFARPVNAVEFFAHSPFAMHSNDTLIDRNECALVFHVTFWSGERDTKLLLIGDCSHQVLSDIVETTMAHNRAERLAWDIYDVPHHCSYLALSGDKGRTKTVPTPGVKKLLDHGRQRGILVSCSDPIPKNDEDSQPPHRQAARTYADIADSLNGEFIVTMEHPSPDKPEPLVITIDEWKATVRKVVLGGGGPTLISRAPRAGIS